MEQLSRLSFNVIIASARSSEVIALCDNDKLCKKRLNEVKTADLEGFLIGYSDHTLILAHKVRIHCERSLSLLKYFAVTLQNHNLLYQ